MKNILYASIISIGICGISEGMDSAQEEVSSGSHIGQAEVMPVTPTSLAQEYVQNLRLGELPSLKRVSKAIKETHFRTYWRSKGEPGKGSEYSKKVASLVLEKIPETDTRENFQKVRAILNRINTGKVGDKSLSIKDCSFLRDMPQKVLNALGIW